jgi:hypothetical protein
MKYHKPKGYGRASLLSYFLSQVEGERWKDPPPYSRRLDLEIHRIAMLPQPWRTIRSVALIEAFRDAKTVTECIRRGRELSNELLKTKTSLDELNAKVMSQRWRRRAAAENKLETRKG